MKRLLVSVRGPVEALEAARGGAAIADVEYPASALGTPYPFNILAVRERLDAGGFRRTAVSTNIGEHPFVRATSCQAALGVAVAGADYIKFGLAEQPFDAAAYLGESVVRTVRRWFPRKRLYPAVFLDDDMGRFFDPLVDGPRLVKAIKSDGLLVDTYNKAVGKGLLDYTSLREVRVLARTLHRQKRELWVAGSLVRDDLPGLWAAGADVICVRGAACEPQKASLRFGRVSASTVRILVRTISGVE